MAYAVLLSLTQTIDRILSHDYHRISVNGRQQIERLREQAIYLQRFLKKYSKESSFLKKYSKESMMSLERRIRDAANQAEGVMEHKQSDLIRSMRSEALGGIQYDFGELTREIDPIAAEAAAMEAETGSHPAAQPAARAAATPAPEVDSFTVGLEEHLKGIKVVLFGKSKERQVIPIAGMGGIGKTTLAKKVYHDVAVMSKFPVRAWITVSQNYKPEDISEELLYSLEKLVTEGLVQHGDTAEEKLHKILSTNKYLIVFDDLWSEKAWDDINIVLGDRGKLNGNRIVITTRNERVGSSSSSTVGKMDLMDGEKSWALLKHKVFPNKECPLELEKIGQDIARSCKGLPLAIVLVAGVLSDVGESRESWEEVADDVHSAIRKNGEFDRIMSLSYTYLPLYLRPCFLYMGSFAEDYEIRVSKLIKLWIAEGFVKSEDEAERYLSDLMNRSLIFPKTIKSSSKVKSCDVHDIVRNLWRRVAVGENYERRLSISHENYDRRQSIPHPDLTRLARAYASTLRSVISFRANESSLGHLPEFRLLRVLDVVDTTAHCLPAPVFELFHLRYLAFGCRMEAPCAISRLQNLRALIIRPSKRLRRHSMDEVYLPLEIWMVPLLTHLVSFFDLLPNPEEAAAALNELVTLTVVKKLICTEEMMKMISNLKKLGITYFGDRYKQDYQLQNLVLLQNLEKLTLIVEKGSPLKQQKDKPVYPKTLRKLTLSGWQLPWGDMKAVGSLPNLQVLKLRNHACEGHKWEIDEEIVQEADLEQFPKLEYLLIDESDLQEWVVESGNFPILKRLMFHRCPNLSKIPDAIGENTVLELIGVDRENMSLVECVQQIHKEREDDGSTTLKIELLANSPI